MNTYINNANPSCELSAAVMVCLVGRLAIFQHTIGIFGFDSLQLAATRVRAVIMAKMTHVMTHSFLWVGCLLLLLFGKLDGARDFFTIIIDYIISHASMNKSS